ncbi:MAG: hypothetical protein GX416_13985, partial [Bacteroidales bacterium]|nr:hypothetical protein [Bacteroidales bacterium]
NNPGRYVDPNGEEFSDFVDKNSNLITHIDDGSNAVFQQTGSGTSLHYSFIGYNDQGGENGVTSASVTSAIQEQQILNMENSALQDIGKGTHCNQGTQNILSTIQSIIPDISIQIRGKANDMNKILLSDKNIYYSSVSAKEAFAYANKGGLAIVTYTNPDPNRSGHIATLGVGKNKNTVANIGPKMYTGFVPLNKAISKNKPKVFFIFLINKLQTVTIKY